MGLYRTVFEINKDNCKIILACVSSAPLREFPFEFCNGAVVKKTRMMLLPESQKSVMSIRLDI